jgi:UDP-glucose 4-epimerase
MTGRGKRVLVTGMGSELGSHVAARLEAEAWVGDIAGLDVDPPRRRLRRATFHRLEPLDRRRTVDVISRFDPHVVVHLAVWEPNARADATTAPHWTAAAAVNMLGAAAGGRSLQAIVVRSGINVYGRRRGSPTRPDESVRPDPTSSFGRSLLALEEVAVQAAATAGVPVTLLRLAPVLGPHVPSPLGRFLRLPVVPMSLLADPSFSVLGHEDAARAVVAATRHHPDGPVNVVADGAVTASQAARIGSRWPIPLVGPEWVVAKAIAAAVGAPVPDHVLEIIHRGQTADGSRAEAVLRMAPERSTVEVVRALYEWATVLHLRPSEAAA